MLFDIDQKPFSALAAVDDAGGQLTYGELVGFCGNITVALPKRELVFCLCENKVGRGKRKRCGTRSRKGVPTTRPIFGCLKENARIFALRLFCSIRAMSFVRQEIKLLKCTPTCRC